MYTLISCSCPKNLIRNFSLTHCCQANTAITFLLMHMNFVGLLKTMKYIHMMNENIFMYL